MGNDIKGVAWQVIINEELGGGGVRVWARLRTWCWVRNRVRPGGGHAIFPKSAAAQGGSGRAGGWGRSSDTYTGGASNLRHFFRSGGKWGCLVWAGSSIQGVGWGGSVLERPDLDKRENSNAFLK